MAFVPARYFAGLLFVFGLPMFHALPIASGNELDCAQLEQMQCMTEPVCAFDGRVCAQINDPCEVAWPEFEGTQETCEAMTRCSYTKSEECYCPPNSLCFCSGGGPGRCRLEG